MSKPFAIVLVFAAVCLILANAAPAQLLDAQTAINKIIDAYNSRFPGPSQVYPWEVATLIDPNTFVPRQF
ncbi:uncharacterized protein [Drosophila virilis]|uniref:Uncharacterized protein n=1 Tax=Drosophila virilis TaxID=7244 RepID=B4ME15_DROVI|nr:uncharacterized protein LOC6635928 [Drosophila virilis]EDW58780.1 uncharacterized protein Dvir_GJ17664 [Drosophila virilis]